MGKNEGRHASDQAGSDTTASSHDTSVLGILERDPTKRYMRFDDPLGKGAYKKVWKAFDQIDGIEVAWNRVNIDRMLTSPENLSRLYSEVHFLKTLKHENILKYYNSWVDDEKRTINIITELFTSGSLREYRKKHNYVELKAIKNWARQILRGLDYLHSHQPPIIHRDLKCDNIFVNGNNGEVKIGDLGLATMMLQEKAQSVLGTPEFMAPELYEEDYNELVDVYSFGMCMLEMVTLDYPYSECRNAAQIYKRVTMGVKPAALEKVTNLQVREFIEKCLVPASERKSARELLKDPFLHYNNPHDLKYSKIPPLLLPPKSQCNASAEEILLNIEAECQSGSICDNVEENNAELQLPYLELVRTNGENEFWLKGARQDEHSVYFFMQISSSNVPRKNVDFVFYLDSDTSLRVADEMVEQLELADYDVPFISEFIDYLIICLVPDWRPLNEEYSSTDNGSTVENGSSILEHDLSLEDELMPKNNDGEEGSDGLPNRLSSNSTPVNDDDSAYQREVCEDTQPIFGLALAQLLGTSEERELNSGDSLTSIELLGTSEEPKSDSDSSWTFAQLVGNSMEANANTDALSTSMHLGKTSEDAKSDLGESLSSARQTGTIVLSPTSAPSTGTECNCQIGEISTVPNGCLVDEEITKKLLNECAIRSLEEDYEDGLQSEINDIQEHYRHLFQEMTRMREMALENARKRWMRKMGKRPA